MMRYGILCAAALTALAQTAQQGGERLSEMAGRMLERTVQARAALDKDTAAARHYVEEALANITAMEIARPKAPQPFMVTLYTEGVEITVEKPQPVGGRGTANRAQEMPPVQQVVAESTRVAVDVTDAKKRLEAARAAIDSGNMAAARESLAAVDNDVKAETAAGDLPLVKARENLSLALTDVREQRFADAVAPLRAASAGLNGYAQTQGAHAKDAGKLRSEVDALAGTIQQDHSGAEAKIAGWSREIGGWMQPLSAPPVKK